ncbi:hypothetical protein [Williamsia sp. CHRR-6]|uniref:Rv0361 family membrane protein n=1 Tax=Williamsia sp. CHRR-6 TaxID=2835871 RepID=UPI001BD93E0B|nr:hypothetical protein [Williamsia sp. CHRR-6]MBT0566190.1 hypothetical protein [Williamsia sp. CHRR-6]
MSHPDDTGNSAAAKAISALRKLRTRGRQPAATFPPATSPRVTDVTPAPPATDETDTSETDTSQPADAVAEAQTESGIEPTAATDSPESEPAENPEPETEVGAEVTEDAGVVAETEDAAEVTEDAGVVAEAEDAAEVTEDAGVVAEAEDAAEVTEDAGVVAEAEVAEAEVAEADETPEPDVTAGPDLPEDPPPPVPEAIEPAPAIEAIEPELSADEPSAADEPPVDEAPVGEAPVGEAPVENPPVDEAPAEDDPQPAPTAEPEPALSKKALAAQAALAAANAKTAAATASAEATTTGAATPVLSAAEVAAAEAPTQTIPAQPSAPTDSRDARAAGADWRSDSPAPQYIPPTQDPVVAPRSSKKVAVWIASLAVIVVAVAAVIGAVLLTRDDPAKPEADVAAETATKYTSALAAGDLTTLRAISCGERKQFYDRVDPAAFKQQFETQKANNELVAVRDVRAAKVVDPENAVVEVLAFVTKTPEKTVPVVLKLRKESSGWKVCSAG